MELEIGNIVEGKVTRVTPFGAFIQLAPGCSGLIHISEIADAFVSDISEYVRANDVVKVKVLSIDKEGKKIALSLKRATDTAKDTSASTPPPPPVPHKAVEKAVVDSFEDRLAKFMKDSNERQLALKKQQDTKKGR